MIPVRVLPQAEAELLHVRYALVFAADLERLQALWNRRRELEPEGAALEPMPVL